MNEENLNYLKKSLLYTGFNEKLNESLEANIQQQPKEFQLQHLGEFKRGEVVEKVQFNLDFRKSDTSDMYFFNKYNATLKNEDPSKDLSQTFYNNKDFTITAKEAFNLLSGRAVNKDMTTKDKQEYNAWLQIDFSKRDEKNENFEMKKFSQGYGFDLEAVVNRYPIKELNTNDGRTKLLASLEKGNVHPVTFVKEGKEEQMNVAANPQFKTLYLYDANMKKVFQGNEKREEQKASQKQEVPKVNDDDDQKKTKKRGVSI